MRWPKGDLVGFDLESTGIHPEIDLPVEYAFVIRENGKMTTIGSLVNPGMPIPAEATEIHGITDDDVKDAPTLDEAITSIVDVLIWASKEQIPLLGMNLSYDLTMIDYCLRSQSIEHDSVDVGLIDMGWDGPVLDLFVLDKHYDQWRKGSRRLDALSVLYGVQGVGDAHRAVGDVYSAVRAILAMSERYDDVGVKSPRELHRLQSYWAVDQTRSLSEYFVKTGHAPIPESKIGWPIAGMTPEP
jgi:DNA polymerase-3 subunit epsilon